MAAQKMLVVGGLFFLLVSMLYGSIYATFYLDHFSQERKAALQNGFNDKLAAETNASRYENTLRAAGQHRSSHSHFALFGLIALAVGVGIQYINLSELWLKITAVIFLCGGFILPFGVFLEPMYNKDIGSLVAMIGGILITLATTAFLVGAWRYQASRS